MSYPANRPIIQPDDRSVGRCTYAEIKSAIRMHNHIRDTEISLGRQIADDRRMRSIISKRRDHTAIVLIAMRDIHFALDDNHPADGTINSKWRRHDRDSRDLPL